jgi:hypothetical protein
MYAGAVGSGRNKQTQALPIASKRNEQLVPIGLVELIHLAAKSLCFYFGTQMVQKDTVKSQFLPSVF